MRTSPPNRERRNGVTPSMTTLSLARPGVRGARSRARTTGLPSAPGHASPATSAVYTSDEAEVREVYLAHFGALAGWASHLVGDRDLGHDLATEAFVRLLGTWGTVDQPRPWLYTTVANLVKDHWRKRGREGAAYRRFQGGADPDVAVDHRPDAAVVLSVRDAVESLPERLRLAVVLHYFADLTVAEVARALGKAEGTIKSDLHEARRRLAPTLESAR